MKIAFILFIILYILYILAFRPNPSMPVKWAERNRLATTQNPSIFNKWIDTK